jgi:hypothetical protein
MSVNFYLTTRSHIPEVLFIVTAVGTSALSYWYKFCVSCWYFMIRNGKACIGLPAIRSSRVMLGRLYAIVLEMKHSRGRFKYFACVLLLEDKVTNVNTFRVKKLARQPTAWSKQGNLTGSRKGPKPAYSICELFKNLIWKRIEWIVS